MSGNPSASYGIARGEILNRILEGIRADNPRLTPAQVNNRANQTLTILEKMDFDTLNFTGVPPQNSAGARAMSSFQTAMDRAPDLKAIMDRNSASFANDSDYNHFLGRLGSIARTDPASIPQLNTALSDPRNSRNFQVFLDRVGRGEIRPDQVDVALNTFSRLPANATPVQIDQAFDQAINPLIGSAPATRAQSGQGAASPPPPPTLSISDVQPPALRAAIERLGPQDEARFLSGLASNRDTYRFFQGIAGDAETLSATVNYARTNPSFLGQMNGAFRDLNEAQERGFIAAARQATPAQLNTLYGQVNDNTGRGDTADLTRFTAAQTAPPPQSGTTTGVTARVAPQNPAPEARQAPAPAAAAAAITTEQNQPLALDAINPPSLRTAIAGLDDATEARVLRDLANNPATLSYLSQIADDPEALSTTVTFMAQNPNFISQMNGAYGDLRENRREGFFQSVRGATPEQLTGLYTNVNDATARGDTQDLVNFTRTISPVVTTGTSSAPAPATPPASASPPQGQAPTQPVAPIVFNQALIAEFLQVQEGGSSAFRDFLKNLGVSDADIAKTTNYLLAADVPEAERSQEAIRRQSQFAERLNENPSLKTIMSSPSGNLTSFEKDIARQMFIDFSNNPTGMLANPQLFNANFGLFTPHPETGKTRFEDILTQRGISYSADAMADFNRYINAEDLPADQRAAASAQRQQLLIDRVKNNNELMDMFSGRSQPATGFGPVDNFIRGQMGGVINQFLENPEQYLENQDNFDNHFSTQGQMMRMLSGMFNFGGSGIGQLMQYLMNAFGAMGNAMNDLQAQNLGPMDMFSRAIGMIFNGNVMDAYVGREARGSVESRGALYQTSTNNDAVVSDGLERYPNGAEVRRLGGPQGDIVVAVTTREQRQDPVIDPQTRRPTGATQAAVDPQGRPIMVDVTRHYRESDLQRGADNTFVRTPTGELVAKPDAVALTPAQLEQTKTHYDPTRDDRVRLVWRDANGVEQSATGYRSWNTNGNVLFSGVTTEEIGGRYLQRGTGLITHNIPADAQVTIYRASGVDADGNPVYSNRYGTFNMGQGNLNLGGATAATVSQAAQSALTTVDQTGATVDRAAPPATQQPVAPPNPQGGQPNPQAQASGPVPIQSLGGV
jgi:hypothetical protein